MSTIRNHQFELAVGQLTYATAGTGGGQVATNNTETELELDVFNGNDTTLITKHSSGRIQVNAAGWYLCNLNLLKIDGTDTSQLCQIQYSTNGGSSFDDVTEWTQQDILHNNRTLHTSGIIYLATGALVRGQGYSYTHTTRWGYTSSARKTQSSLTVVRVG